MNQKPLISAEDTQPDEAISLKIRPTICQELRAYSEYSNSSKSHVAAEALKRLFAADKGFRAYLKANPKAGLEAAPIRDKAAKKSAAA